MVRAAERGVIAEPFAALTIRRHTAAPSLLPRSSMASARWRASEEFLTGARRNVRSMAVSRSVGQGRRRLIADRCKTFPATTLRCHEQAGGEARADLVVFRFLAESSDQFPESPI